MATTFDKLYSIARRIVAKTPIGRRMMPSYAYNFTPAQLAFLVNCVTETRNVDGCILEVGCATGYTTLFLANHLKFEGIAKKYVCVDTFEGFTASDVAFERMSRGKTTDNYRGFSINDLGVFQATMRQRGVDVHAIKADISAYDFPASMEVAFCLLDVDLFTPTKRGLSRIWPIVSRGGIVVIDDVKDNNLFDGAFEAYREFCAEEGIQPEVHCGKLGVLRKKW